MALADEIKKRLQASQAAAPAGSQQAAAQQVMTAKTGKAAGTGTTPRASARGEALAQSQIAAQQGQLRGQAVAAAEQLGAQQEAVTGQAAQAQAELEAQRDMTRADLASQQVIAGQARAGQEALAGQQLSAEESMAIDRLSSSYQQAMDKLATDRGIKLDDIFHYRDKSRKELKSLEFRADLEQTAHRLALADRKYMEELQRIGKMNRLHNDLEWRAEASRMALDYKLQTAAETANFKLDLQADDAEFQKQMAAMTGDHAIALATAQAKDATLAAGLQTLGSLAKTGSDYYKNKPERTQTDKGPGKGGASKTKTAE